MTNEKMALMELIEQASDGDLIREMLAFAASRVMELEIEGKTGAAMAAGGSSASPSWRSRGSFWLPCGGSSPRACCRAVPC